MRFEREINIYGDEAILKRFQANETSVEIIQGKISALISESEIIELENSQATMYSKLASAIMDIDALALNFSDLTTKYNTVSGQYTSLDSKLAQYKAGVDGLSVEITHISQDLDTLETWKNDVSVKITDSAIITTVTESNNYKASVNSLIEQKANSIRLKATTIAWESTYSSMTSAGTLTCRNATIEGTIHSDNGDDEIYMRSARLEFIRDGIDVGNIGTNVNRNNNAQKGLVFDLDYTGHFMSWGVKKNTSATEYTMIWAYSRVALTGSTYKANTLNAGCDIDMHNYTLDNVSWPGGGITATINYVQVLKMNSDGTVAQWGANGKMVFTNGILTDLTYYEKK